MRLLNFGTGELLDRVTILDLKIEHGSPDLVDHFVKERQGLLMRIAPDQTQAWFLLALQLAMVNGLLWRAEDDLRRYRVGGITGPDLGVVVTIAFEIQLLNDERASLVEQINKLTGEHHGSEKL